MDEARANTRAPTIKDVAQAAGVSAATVSYVINKSSKALKLETRERVLNAIRELGYYPSAIARGLQARRMNTLGVVVFPHADSSPLSSPYYVPILDGVIAVTLRNDQGLTLFAARTWSARTHEWTDAEQRLQDYCDGRCDGLLFIGPPQAANLAAAMKDRALPFVFIDEGMELADVCSVDIDNYGAARWAAVFLMDYGHTRITFLEGDKTLDSALKRLNGWADALRDRGVSRGRSIPGEFTFESGYRRTSELLKSDRREWPTALFCANDPIAHGALRALAEAQVEVPREMSVMGFDDISESALARPALTTVRQPLKEIGEQAADILMACIRDRSIACEKRLLPTQLIAREFVAGPRDYV